MTDTVDSQNIDLSIWNNPVHAAPVKKDITVWNVLVMEGKRMHSGEWW
jgi:hypothetical protein